jgi:hypothetical protein
MVRERMCLNAVDDVMMFRNYETILSMVMDHRVPVNPLLMNNIDESSNELGTLRVGEEIPPSLE